MLRWLAEKAYDISVNRFHKRSGLFCSIFLLWLVALSFYKLIPGGKLAFSYYFYALLTLSLILFICWTIHVWHYPKRSNKRLGVTIAIHTTGKEDYNFLKTDFISPLKSKICDLNLPFDVAVLKNHQAEKIETSVDAHHALRRTRAHFCVWGTIKKRKENTTTDKYLFSLRGIVVHEPIREAQKVLLEKEFSSLLPNKIAFEENLQLEAFEFRSSQVFTALEYITGRAALLSCDFKTAIQLHEPLFQAIQSGQPYPIRKDPLRKLLSLEYDLKAAFEFFDPAERGSYKESVRKSLQYNPANYGALLKRAIIEFDNGNGDPRIALLTIDQAKQHAAGGYHWLYSKAFLYFWLGEYDNALKCCDRLKEKSYAGEEITILEVIKFNEDLLNKFQKTQLYYWLGFVNYVKDKNPAAADVNFQEFFKKADDSMHILQIRAQSYMANTKKDLGYE